MIIQISSGQGPAECELAVSKLFEALKKEYPDIELLHSHSSRITGGLHRYSFQQKEICLSWKEVSSGFAEVRSDQIIRGKTGLSM